MPERYDILIIGAGPGGSAAALTLARAGLRVCMVEKDSHPRFHIGESILPRTEVLLRELGLSERVRTLPHLPKFGAEFGFGNDAKTMRFSFTDGLLPGFAIFNIERAHLDRCLAEAATEAGAELRQQTTVRAIERLHEGGVTLAIDGPAGRDTLSADVLIDASGHGTIVGRHLGTRRTVPDPDLQKVAYFAHFAGVEQLPGDLAGHPGIFMCDEGWFWVIGLSPGKTSVGFVAHPSLTKTTGVPADRMLAWAIERCPVVRDRMRAARQLETEEAIGRNQVLADFSYTCGPAAGPGYFLVGDAGRFLDPIFSTGVTLALIGGHEAAKQIIAIRQGEQTPARARAAYRRIVEGSTHTFWRLIKGYYRHPFRELFMNGTGPHQTHKAVISVLAGQVFPRPVWALRWRVHLFFACVALQRFLPLVPRRPRFSLVAEPPVPVAGLTASPGRPASAPPAWAAHASMPPSPPGRSPPSPAWSS